MIITFYSYKGGVGRSMALANVAAWLAAQGLRVAVVDWDLEAPGIEAYFEPDAARLSEIRRSHGLMDLLVAYRDLHPTLDDAAPAAGEEHPPSQAPEAASTPQRAEALRNALPTIGSSLQPMRGAPRASRRRTEAGIRVLSAGAREGELFGTYAQNVQSFDWATFYADWDGAAFFHWLRDELESYCDITLIDSRTGVTEMSGVCTRGLADHVVSMCAANVSNLDGVLRMTRWFLEPAVKELRGRPLSAMIIPSRIDGRVETAELQGFKKRFLAGVRTLEDVDPDVAPELWWDLQIGYIGLYSFQERIVTGQAGESEYLQRDYDKLARRLTKHFLAKSPDARIDLARRPIGAVLQQLLSEVGVDPVLQADAVLAALSSDDQARALRVLTRFVKLARADEGGGATAVQVPVSKFTQRDRPLVDRLVANGLLTSDESGTGRSFRLSQPPLVTEWNRLASSIEADRAFLEWRQRIADGLADWERYRSDTSLLAGRALAEALLWVKTRSDDVAQEELEFVARSEKVTLSERGRGEVSVSSRRLVVVGNPFDWRGRSYGNEDRLLSAIDLTDGEQLAHFTTRQGGLFEIVDGVLSLFGWGAKRDVLGQYRFLCTHYQPGDRIFLFGSGRGAFRVRMLLGLIAQQGLIADARGSDLMRLSRWAYREYRRQFYTVGAIVQPLRFIRDAVLRVLEIGRRRYDWSHNLVVDVTFVGVWDTVLGYGLPFEELTMAWDKWIWPLSTDDARLPQNVQKVCHALALDEDRQALDPVLFDESHERFSAHVDQERLTQVWFAGAHENVAGGAADDSLAAVSLQWMVEEAEKKGLRLLRHVREEWSGRANPLGHVVPGRWGLGRYYRYRPRSLQRLGNDRYALVSVGRPKIHESVFQRISALKGDYAPIAIPERYAVVTRYGDLVDGDQNRYEHPTQAVDRCAKQDAVWDLVWLRRVVYGTCVAVAIAMLVLPAFSPGIGLRSRVLSGIVGMLREFVPSLFLPWVDWYVSYPFGLLIPGVLLGLLLLTSNRLDRSIHERMRSIWESIVDHGPRWVDADRVVPTRISRFRTHPVYRHSAQVISSHFLPFAFGLTMLSAMLVVVGGTVNRAIFSVASAAGDVCRAVVDPRLDVRRWIVSGGNRQWTVMLPSADICYSTGITLEAGVPYRIAIELPSDWSDRTRSVISSDGFPTDSPVMFFALPFRRVLTERWFVPIARIGETEQHALDENTLITPGIGGPLFLFVNDAVGMWPYWTYFYQNNNGLARVVVIDTREAATDNARVGVPTGESIRGRREMQSRFTRDDTRERPDRSRSAALSRGAPMSR